MSTEQANKPATKPAATGPVNAPVPASAPATTQADVDVQTLEPHAPAVRPQATQASQTGSAAQVSGAAPTGTASPGSVPPVSGASGGAQGATQGTRMAAAAVGQSRASGSQPAQQPQHPQGPQSHAAQPQMVQPQALQQPAHAPAAQPQAAPAQRPAAQPHSRPQVDSKTRVIVVTSGKGGVGKTTTSASFATGLALQGYKTAVIDFDVGLRNLDLIMGCERRVVYDLINVIQGEANLKQALIKDKQTENLYVLAASQTRDKEALTLDGVQRVLDGLREMDFDYIVCDSPAGIESGALMAMHFADEAIIVTNPEVSSVRDSDRILGILASKTQRAIEGREGVREHLLITRYNPTRVNDGQMLSLDDVTDILRIDLIGIIPESETVLQASNQGIPAVHMAGSDVAGAYQDVIARFLGEQRPLRYITAPKAPGFFKRLFGGK